MSKFWYFLGGCAAGALAVAAVQAVTEDNYRSSSSSHDDDNTEDDVHETILAEDSPESEEVTAHFSVKSWFSGMAENMAQATPPPEMQADMQKMSEMLATSVIGIVGEFLRHNQARMQESTATDSGEDISQGPIIPNFGAAQA